MSSPETATCEQSGGPAAGDRFGPVGGGLFLLRIVFGFVTGIGGDVELTHAWLVIGYVLVLFIIVTAFGYHAQNDAKLKVGMPTTFMSGARMQLPPLGRTSPLPA